jgi:hypothetical protein
MAQEPQSVPPRPLRLQADYLRLRDEQRALQKRMTTGDRTAIEPLKAKQQEVVEFIRTHKDKLNG